MPGVEIHANVLETYVSGNRLREVPAAVSTALAVVAALLAAALVVRLHPLRALAAVTAAGSRRDGLRLPRASSTPTSGCAPWRGRWRWLLGYGVTVVDSFVREQRERRRLSQFFSPEVLREVVRHRDEAQPRLEPAPGDRAVLRHPRLHRAVGEAGAGGRGRDAARVPHRDDRGRSSSTAAPWTSTSATASWPSTTCRSRIPTTWSRPCSTALDLQERTLEVSARWEARLGAADPQRRRHQHRRGGGGHDGLPPAPRVHRHRRHHQPRPRAWSR